LHITDYRTFQPMRAQIHLLAALRQLFPEHDFFTDRVSSFDLAMGSDQVRKDLAAGKSAAEIIGSWQDELDNFLQIRARYLIYKEN